MKTLAWPTLGILITFNFGCSSPENPLANAPEYPIQNSVLHSVVNEYCVECHNPEDMEGELDLQSIVDGTLNENPFIWQDVAWALSSGEMPPEDEPEIARPNADTYAAVNQWLEKRLDAQAQSNALIAAEHPEKFLVDRFCLSCHNEKDKKGNLVLTSLVDAEIEEQAELWERALRKLNARQMPPPDRKRPNETAYQHVVSHLTGQLDALASANPYPGKTETFRRLTRTEYQNAIRDLLHLKVDASAYLPTEQHSHGFDNVTVSNLSPTLFNRYISTAQKIAKLAVGDPDQKPSGATYRTLPDQSQESHIPGLPLGTQGGMLVSHYFPVAGEYQMTVRLSRDRDEKIEGFHEPQNIEMLLNGEVIKSLRLVPPSDHKQYDFDESQLKATFTVPAGEYDIGVTFPRLDGALLTTERLPFNSAFNLHRHPRQSLAVYEVSIIGPFKTLEGQIAQPDSTPSRARIFSCHPLKGDDEHQCAKQILSSLAKSAYRRPLKQADIDNVMGFYRQDAAAGFERGIERGISAILVNPNFLFKIEQGEPSDDIELLALNNFELASRLSFFIWNSIPDDTLLSLAEQGRLTDPNELREQAKRLLADERAVPMIRHFTEQWLHLKNLKTFTPDARLFPDFDNNLREAMAEETLLFTQSILQSDRPVVDLLDAGYSFLNQRLAKHYDVPHVYGSRFRKVQFDDTIPRGGLLRHASVLTVTSYATRTSPVVRGNWILENFIGTPPPPPPPDIPSLDNDVIAEALPIRVRLNKHREDPACAGCHNLMDPIGFALENYDAVGRWRTSEHGHPVDASAGLPDGNTFIGAEGMLRGMKDRPDLFVSTLTEKLMIFALGRGLEYTDAPFVRDIVRRSAQQNYAFSAIVAGLVETPSFRYRASSTTHSELAALEGLH